MKQDMIVILDPGSTENTKLARDIREMGVYSVDLSPRYHSQRTERNSFPMLRESSSTAALTMLWTEPPLMCVRNCMRRDTW